MEKDEFLRVLDETGADAARFRYLLAHPNSASGLLDAAMVDAEGSSREFDRLVRERIDARIAKRHREAAAREG